MECWKDITSERNKKVTYTNDTENDLIFNGRILKGKIPPYRLSIINKLKNSNMTFCNKVSNLLEFDIRKDIIAENLMADAIIELENLLNKTLNELSDYKKLYGELKHKGD